MEPIFELTSEPENAAKLEAGGSCSGLGRHLSNISDHRKLCAETRCCYSYHDHFDPAARRHEWESHLRWINENVIGPPKATDRCTQAQLEEMGMIGIYAPIDGQNA